MNNLRDFEDKLISGLNIKYIAGVDEVGRGPLAGPVVVCAIILPCDYNNKKINDSKKLSKKLREQLYTDIINNAISYSIVETSVEEIDKLNILNATKKSMEIAVNKLSPLPDFILTDYVRINSNIHQLNLIKGDSISITIAASSIVAKVHRDRIMIEYSKKYPVYEWETNMGYGTKKHIEAIKKNGWTDLHRKSFEPVKSMILQSLF
ncbi:MAG: ribonuclease HII [Candidatus Muirbacterium halophilum]|nr:ribonuclease HII [Candidatus Muirbacterium halophilum]MCK9475986.1 ribonuclease HII [Candidatus Muirbacterium halophilum]